MSFTMPLRTIEPILHLEPASLMSLDTANVMSFHGLWTVFSKCSETLENGKRLENLSWRMYSRESSVCNKAANKSTSPSRASHTKTAPLDRIPELSSSIESNASSDDALFMPRRTTSKPARPEIVRVDSVRAAKHISPLDLKTMVNNISEKKTLEPLSPLPLSMSLCNRSPMADVKHTTLPIRSRSSTLDAAQSEEPTPTAPRKVRMDTEASTSTVATDPIPSLKAISPSIASSQTSASTELSESKLIRGFSRDCISSYNHSRTNLIPTPSQSILKHSPSQSRAEPIPKGKKKAFFIGPSSEEESSFENRSLGNSGLMQIHRRSNPKRTSFKDDALIEQIQEKRYESSDVFEDTDEDDSDVIDEDDDEVEDEWEDDEESGSPPKVNEREFFQRVDSKPNLVSRKSLLSTMMHEGDRANALQNLASRSTTAIRRSRTTSPNGPVGSSPVEQRMPYMNPQAFQSQASDPRSITAGVSSAPIPPTLSPRTSRRLMLSSELPDSLRKSIVWERQQKQATKNAVLKRRHTSKDIQSLTQFPGPQDQLPQVHLNGSSRPHLQVGGSFNNYFDNGLQEYHQKGW